MDFRTFQENADRIQKIKQQQQDGMDRYKKSLQTGIDNVKRREMNDKRAKLRDRMKAKGINDDDGLLDDDED